MVGVAGASLFSVTVGPCRTDGPKNHAQSGTGFACRLSDQSATSCAVHGHSASGQSDCITPHTSDHGSDRFGRQLAAVGTPDASESRLGHCYCYSCPHDGPERCSSAVKPACTSLHDIDHPWSSWSPLHLACSLRTDPSTVANLHRFRWCKCASPVSESRAPSRSCRWHCGRTAGSIQSTGVAGSRIDHPAGREPHYNQSPGREQSVDATGTVRYQWA